MALNDYINNYFERKRQRKEEYLKEEARSRWRSVCNYILELEIGKKAYMEWRHGRSRPETEFERRAVYDIMHGVGGQKEWPGW